MEHEFYEEIRRRNKDKFIKVRTQQLIEAHKEDNGVSIPEFLDAEKEYDSFKKAGCFDKYGYLKPIQQ